MMWKRPSRTNSRLDDMFGRKSQFFQPLSSQAITIIFSLFGFECCFQELYFQSRSFRFRFGKDPLDIILLLECSFASPIHFALPTLLKFGKETVVFLGSLRVGNVFNFGNAFAVFGGAGTRLAIFAGSTSQYFGGSSSCLGGFDIYLDAFGGSVLFRAAVAIGIVIIVWSFLRGHLGVRVERSHGASRR